MFICMYVYSSVKVELFKKKKTKFKGAFAREVIYTSLATRPSGKKKKLIKVYLIFFLTRYFLFDSN